MKDETTKALDFIRLIADRAVQRGNIFNSTIEVVNFYNTLSYFAQVADELEKIKMNGLGNKKQEIVNQ